MTALRLHHTGIAVRELAAAVRRYGAALGYVPVTGPIHDPRQTAWVQFLRLPGDSAYLELVAPDGPESRLAGAVRRGGGVHHVCFVCGGMEETVARLEAQGWRLIREPVGAVALGGRRICWLLGEDSLLVELVERRDLEDLCEPGVLPVSGSE